MRLETVEEFEAVKEELQDTQTFQIKATPVIFKLMSKDIYRDKIMAVVRELITNAVDAMVEAGTIETMQYKLFVPNSTTPEFYVRDYGTGLDDEGVKAIYTYGDSSRNKDNNFTGAFGIGAKAPFAYTNKFYIEAFKDKVKRSYEAFLVEGVPVIKKTNEEPTEELNGVKVTVPVKDGDHCDFFERVAKFFKFYKHIPASNVNIESIRAKFECFMAYPDEENPVYALTNDYSTVHIVMGGIDYTAMSLYDFKDRVYGKWNYNDYGLISRINKSLYIFAPLGKYPVLPSREEIDLSSERAFQMLKEDYLRIESMVAQNLRNKFYTDIEEYSFNIAVKNLEMLMDRCYFDEVLDNKEDKEKAVKIAAMFKNEMEIEFGDDTVTMTAFPTSKIFVSTRSSSFRTAENKIGNTEFLVRDYRSAVDKLPPNFVSHSLPNEVFNMENYVEYVVKLAKDKLGYSDKSIRFLSDIIAKPEPVKRPKGVKRSIQHDINEVKGYSFSISKDDKNIDTATELSSIDLTSDNSYYVSFDDMKYRGSIVRNWIRMLHYIRMYRGESDCSLLRFYGISINYCRKFAKDPEFMYKHSLIDHVKKFLAETEMPQFDDKYEVLLYNMGSPRSGYEPCPIAKDVLKFLPLYLKAKIADDMEYTLADTHAGNDVEVKRRKIDCSDLDYIMELIDYNKKTKYFVRELSSRKDCMFRGLKILKYLKAEGKLEDFFPADQDKW